MGALTKRVLRWLSLATSAVALLRATKAQAEGGAGAVPNDVDRSIGAAPSGENRGARVRFALQVEPAFGLTGDGFYNQLAGARVDYRFTDQIALGGYLGYANLHGKDGRAHNVLPYLNLEYRLRLGEKSAFGLPLAWGSGYLPNNGPFLRLSAGVSYAVSPHIDVVVALFTPTFWIVHDRTVISLGAALEISYAP
ncbi:MAG TPA: hypothetical protein VK550_15960 [Polyangiaceae bacterium]|nr:hypothetical protein [Polyangiaceae bacterium]